MTGGLDDIRRARRLVELTEVTEEGWGQPIPLTPSLPRFPVRALGPAAPWAHELAHEMQVPPDLVALPMLAAVSGLVGRRARVQVSGSHSEPLNTYSMVIAAPGEKKTPVLARVRAPLAEIERQLQEEAMPEVERARLVRDRLEARRKGALQRLGKATKEEVISATEREVEDLVAELAKNPVPVLPRLFADDATPEALNRLLHRHHGTLGVLTSEGGLFENLMGRYSRGVANLDGVLKAWDGREPIVVDRSSNAEDNSCRVEQPCLTLCFAVQPAVLQAIGANPDMAGRGFLGRFFYAVPASNVGYRDVTATGQWHGVRPWSNIINHLNSQVQSDTTLRLTEEADMILGHAHRAWEVRMRPGEDLAATPEWSNKILSHATRLAGLLHLLRVGGEGGSWAVSEASMSAALEVVEYLVPHAIHAHELMGLSGNRQNPVKAALLLAWIREGKPVKFTVREAQTVLRKRHSRVFTEADIVRDAALTLVEHGYLQVDEPWGTKPRSFRVTPYLDDE